jgi:RimJ/RimL family protein N-acetyltransferase
MNIKGKFVTLRAMQREDMPMIVEMFNDPELEKSVVGWAFPLSLEQQNKWFDNHMNDQTNFRFVIETPDDGVVGIATLTDIDWKNRNAMQGIKLKKEARGKGIATDAVMAIMRYAFDELGLHRLNGSWFEDNVASQTLYQKCGWTAEGCRREYVFKQGKWKNLVVCGVLAEDYYSLITKCNYWRAN